MKVQTAEAIEPFILPFYRKPHARRQNTFLVKQFLDEYVKDRSKWGRGKWKSEEEFIKEAINYERLLFIWHRPPREVLPRQLRENPPDLLPFGGEARVIVHALRRNPKTSQIEELVDGVHAYDQPGTDGRPRLRRRNFHGLREKMYLVPPEDPLLSAVFRTIFEETGRTVNVVYPDRFIPGRITKTAPEGRLPLRMSTSYPGFVISEQRYFFSLMFTEDEYGLSVPLPETYFPEGTFGYIERQTHKSESKRKDDKTCYVSWQPKPQGRRMRGGF